MSRSRSRLLLDGPGLAAVTGVIGVIGVTGAGKGVTASGVAGAAGGDGNGVTSCHGRQKDKVSCLQGNRHLIGRRGAIMDRIWILQPNAEQG